MPKFDGTGPAGKGPKTGAQMGNCQNTYPARRPFDGRGEGRGQQKSGQSQGKGFGRKFLNRITK